MFPWHQVVAFLCTHRQCESASRIANSYESCRHTLLSPTFTTLNLFRNLWLSEKRVTILNPHNPNFPTSSRCHSHDQAFPDQFCIVQENSGGNGWEWGYLTHTQDTHTCTSTHSVHTCRTKLRQTEHCWTNSSLYSPCYKFVISCYFTDSETHFKVIIVSGNFEGIPLLEVCHYWRSAAIEDLPLLKIYELLS